ncbi:NADP-dependent 3-hydroxy acid dehydrogenase YdfG [Sinobacterium caligoides]|uniref:NADP-dependent 3-hydroxy acid dehydrogenase YdfG n=1 Tax=Sinobacterium caligoides TaxID=933926 RepID=A0A3N2DGY6_9GAMM|nr:SDR family NAD(P)-dependent oxidoreductase [Sinobacterium caligoides]ROR99060.1 NADP-dependent 3-hydroxy acid dehydrogenase YdfG [Sinobacterium caligoides]
MQDFNNKVAVITGGASGVGRSIAFKLGAEGAKIVIADVDKKALEQSEQALTAAGIEALAVVADVTKQESLEALAEAAIERFGGMHLVFANAGISSGEGGNMWEYNKNDWEWGFNVNVWGVVNSINAFIPRLVEQGEEAHFVVTGSGNGGLFSLPDQPIYTATKAAVMMITENLYHQLLGQESPVKVNALFPGPHVVDTGLFDSDRVRPEELPIDPNKVDSGIHSVDDMKNMMREYGMELETTHPDHVADNALKGLREEQFWIMELSEKSAKAVQDRAEMILKGINPTLPNIL